MADTPDLGSGALRRKGSSPFSRRLFLFWDEPERKEHREAEFSLDACGNSSVVERHLAKVDVAGRIASFFVGQYNRGIAGFHLLLF